MENQNIRVLVVVAAAAPSESISSPELEGRRALVLLFSFDLYTSRKCWQTYFFEILIETCLVPPVLSRYKSL